MAQVLCPCHRSFFLLFFSLLMGLALAPNSFPKANYESDVIASASATSCNVSGFISSNTTWNPSACDPYIVTGGVIVHQGVTLTIEAGTTVKFNSLTTLTVNGTLVTRGTATNPVSFTSNSASPTKGDWGFIHFTNSSTDATFDNSGNYASGSVIQYAILEYAGGASVTENGALRVEASSPYIDHNTIRNNNADGIHVWNNETEIRITNNTITNSNIGIYVQASAASPNIIISGNTVSNNTSTGIKVHGGMVTISNNTVSACTGGGVYFNYYYTSGTTKVTITTNTISGNSTSTGGGIYNVGTQATITGNTISGNSASTGGGIYNADILATIAGNTINGNSASNGGGIYFVTSWYLGTAQMTIGSNTISGNSASSKGGGMYFYSGLYGNSQVTISGNIISGNSASNGGGIYLYCDWCDNRVTISGNSIGGNSASDGGGIYFYPYLNANPQVTISNNTISDNSTSNRGGGIYLDSFRSNAQVTISRDTIINNTAGQANRGGGIYLCNGCRPTINNSNLYGNMTGNPATAPNDLYNGNSYGGADINAENSYWGTTYSNTIEDHIWHFVDDSSLGTVDYIPYLTTPVAPTTIYLPLILK